MIPKIARDFRTLILIFALTLDACVEATSNTYGNYSGDIVLAAYFPVHGSPTDLTAPYVKNENRNCGHIQEQDGIQVSI